MNATQEMKNTFLEITAEYCSVAVEDMKPEMRYIEDLGFSSFDFMAYLGDLEDEFDVEIDETEVVNIRTLGDVLAYVESIQ